MMVQMISSVQTVEISAIHSRLAFANATIVSKFQSYYRLLSDRDSHLEQMSLRVAQRFEILEHAMRANAEYTRSKLNFEGQSQPAPQAEEFDVSTQPQTQAQQPQAFPQCGPAAAGPASGGAPHHYAHQPQPAAGRPEAFGQYADRTGAPSQPKPVVNLFGPSIIVQDGDDDELGTPGPARTTVPQMPQSFRPDAQPCYAGGPMRGAAQPNPKDGVVGQPQP